jgi:AbiTii
VPLPELPTAGYRYGPARPGNLPGLQIVFLAGAVVTVLAWINFAEHPTARNLGRAVIDTLSLWRGPWNPPVSATRRGGRAHLRGGWGAKIPAMAHKREGLLAQIEAGVLDDTMALSSLLQKCIVLGGQAGSEKMRDWARRELNGYVGAQTVPDYRHIPAALMARITNRAGYNGFPQQLHASIFPDQIRDMVDLEEAVLGGGIGELEALANRDTDEHQLIPPWASLIIETLNRHNAALNSRVDAVYWSLSNASIQGLLVRVRTALAELVAELIALMPRDQEVPDKLAADQATQFVITGDRPTINYSSQYATDSGTNVAVGAPTSGPVTVSGVHGTAIGSQTASGTNSSVVGSQATQGNHSAIAGRAANITGAREQPAKEGWWARLRERGMVVAFTTIIGGIAAAVGAVVTVFVWIGWTPWS